MNFFISIIIPVYNDQKGLDKCLKFISKQNFDRNFEAIIIDNLSEREIYIKKEFSNFARLVKCENKGSYAARNVGIYNAKGEILAFTDADCCIRSFIFAFN